MKLSLSLIAVMIITMIPLSVFATNDTIEKTDCKLAIGYDSMDELKADLLLSAKRLAVNELFGELITAATAVEDFVVTSDHIRASSLGLVREDAIRYYNSEDNLGEVCIDISVYTTDEDRQQFVPIKLNKRNCVSNPDLTNRELRKFAEEEAIVKAILEYNRKLEGQDRNRLLGLMQRVTYLENAMLPDTDSYCVRVEGYVTPIETVALLQSMTPEGLSEKETSGSLLFSDNFDDGDNKEWIVSAGDWNAISNQYLCVTNDDGRTFAGKEDWTDYAVSANIKTFSGRMDVGVLGRVQDASHFYLAQLVNGRARIYRQDNGWIELRSVPYEAVNNVLYTVKMEFRGTQISMYVNDELVATAEDAMYLKGKVGLRCTRSQVYFDDVKVEPLPE